jgi:ATP-binding cassette subfamily B protein
MSNLFRLYLRVLGQLGPEARTGWLLAAGGLGLAVAQFAEPVLFGRIIVVAERELEDVLEVVAEAG